ncbi:MAG: Uma2 family endonuclease [Anaerolineae bacterium]
MASPIRFAHHVAPQTLLWRWLTVRRVDAGLRGARQRFADPGQRDRDQPDGMLLLDTERGGEVRVTDEDYLTGTPAFVFEISASTAGYDLHAKKRLYARIGVPEYLVAAAHEKRLYWFVLRDGEYAALAPDADGDLPESDMGGLVVAGGRGVSQTNDRQAAVAAVAAGVATDEHAGLVARLAQGR